MSYIWALLRSFTFTGPDGIQYQWALGAAGRKPERVSVFVSPPVSLRLNDNLKLVTTDGKKTVIAQFHLPHNKQKARLEIRPVAMDLFDYIIVTFVFVEQTRAHREAAANS